MSQKRHCDACDALITPPFLSLQHVTLTLTHDYRSVIQQGPDLCESRVSSIPEPIRKLLSFTVGEDGDVPPRVWPSVAAEEQPELCDACKQRAQSLAEGKLGFVLCDTCAMKLWRPEQ